MICETVVDLESTLAQYCIQTYSNLQNEYVLNENHKLFIVSNEEYNDLLTINDDIDNDNYILDDNIIDITNEVKNILEKNGFNVDKNSSYYPNIELHFSTSTNSENILKSNFSIHKDDYGGIDCTVNTFIIYFDVNCYGGDIAFYDSNDVKNYYTKKSDIVDDEYIENETNILIPTSIINTQNPSSNTCKIVMFEGNIYHKPLDYCNGHRNLMVFQIPK